ncbi:MAG: glycosyltransferase [Coriobacteriales bacterium]|nr:glycosyltransferase [Coriobacteriales bacterium]
MPHTLTVVIPALNEAERLPKLLDALASQSRRPDAIIVADAGSADDTRRIAEAVGALVVEGGLPAAGRNAGARAATTELLLFLDADVEPEPDFIELASAEFAERELGCATALVDPLERTPQNLMACEIVNVYLDVMQYVAPHAPGFCILVRRDVHEAINGFDETVVLAEDHDYVQRASGQGKFRVLRSALIPVSMRRIDKEGLVRIAFKYVYCELFAMTGTPIRHVPFEYEFGAFAPSEREVALVDVASLRSSLGKVAGTVATLSADTRDALSRLGSVDLAPPTFEEVLERLPLDDVKALDRYLRRRLAVARRMPPLAFGKMRELREAIWMRLSDNGRG